MKQRSIKRIIKIIAFVLLLAVIPTNAHAIDIPSSDVYASRYLSAYRAYMHDAGRGKVQVCFDVTGTTDMEDIGALSIKLYESKDNSNWTWIKTFDHTDYPHILGHNDYYHEGYVTYSSAVRGRYYKAYVCIWAGRNGGGDQRHFWTSSIKAS